MSILDPDQLDKNLDRFVLEVNPKQEMFISCFQRNGSAPMLVDALHEVAMQAIANDLDAGYFDLSKATSYRPLARAITQYPDGIIFDNIDCIPDSEDKDYISELVRFALKKESEFPLPDNQSIDFDNVRVGVRCKAIPDYLIGESLQTVIIAI